MKHIQTYTIDWSAMYKPTHDTYQISIMFSYLEMNPLLRRYRHSCITDELFFNILLGIARKKGRASRLWTNEFMDIMLCFILKYIRLWMWSILNVVNNWSRLWSSIVTCVTKGYFYLSIVRKYHFEQLLQIYTYR